MQGLRFAKLALVAGATFAAPRALPAQAQGHTFLGASVGVATKPDDGFGDATGLTVGLTLGRVVSRRVALRLDAEYQRFGVTDRIQYVRLDLPCPPLPQGCGSLPPELGRGSISTVAILASAEWYERPDRRGFYLLGGFGPQLLDSRPDRPRSLRLAVQAGAGVAALLGPAALLAEGRYQRALGAGAEPPHVVSVSVSLRFGLGR